MTKRAPSETPRPAASSVDDVMVIRGKEIPVRSTLMKQSTLKFYEENPRIYGVVWKDAGVTPTQHEIYDALSRMEHVRERLVPSIKQNGGLIEPILVRGNVVLEGNSRLAAYRLLAQAEQGKWDHIRAKVLPDNMSESEVFTLLGEYHIVGKKDWQPYEQGGYLYRRATQHGISVDQLKSEVGLAAAEIRLLIRTYDFMIKHDDRSPGRWSYYFELLRGTKFNKARELYPDFDEIVVEKVKSEEIGRAVDLRDHLPLIVKAGGNTLKRFISGSMGFEEAVQDAKQRGAGDYNLKKLQQFRQWLADDALDQEMAEAPVPEKRRLAFELDKIERRAKGLQRKLV
jgi:hypothetical protein